MGKKIAGVDVLLKVSQEDGTQQVVGGQTNCTLNREAETIDTTDKTAGGYTSAMAGLISWSVDADGFVVLGDEAFDLIETAFTSRKPVSVEIRVGDTENAEGVTYTGEGYLVDLPLEFSMDDAVTYSISVEGASPLQREKGAVTQA